MNPIRFPTKIKSENDKVLPKRYKKLVYAVEDKGILNINLYVGETINKNKLIFIEDKGAPFIVIEEHSMDVLAEHTFTLSVDEYDKYIDENPDTIYEVVKIDYLYHPDHMDIDTAQGIMDYCPEVSVIPFDLTDYLEKNFDSFNIPQMLKDLFISTLANYYYNSNFIVFYLDKVNCIMK